MLSLLSRAILRGRGKHQTGLGQAKRGLRGSAPAKCSAHFPFLSSSHPVRDFSLLQLSKFLPPAHHGRGSVPARTLYSSTLGSGGAPQPLGARSANVLATSQASKPSQGLRHPDNAFSVRRAAQPDNASGLGGAQSSQAPRAPMNALSFHGAPRPLGALSGNLEKTPEFRFACTQCPRADGLVICPFCNLVLCEYHNNVLCRRGSVQDPKWFCPRCPPDVVYNFMPLAQIQQTPAAHLMSSLSDNRRLAQQAASAHFESALDKIFHAGQVSGRSHGNLATTHVFLSLLRTR